MEGLLEIESKFSNNGRCGGIRTHVVEYMIKSHGRSTATVTHP
jgi:hypothetical protein